jgi:RNA polymerase sigma factor (sigma-70 family)
MVHACMQASQRGGMMGLSTAGRAMDSFQGIPVPSEGEQLEMGRRIRLWLDWPGGPDAAPRNVARSGARARQQMVERNMRLVTSLANRFAGRGLDVDDLIQEGAIGLTLAVERFDPTRGYQFSTYAFWWVRQSITRALQGMSRSIVIPSQAITLLGKSKAWAIDFRRREGRWPTDEEIAAAFGIQLESLSRLRDADAARDVASLNAPTIEQMTLESLVACPRTSGDITDRISAEQTRELLREFLSRLPELEAQVLQLLIEDGWRHTDIAAHLGLRRSTVQRLERQGLQRLRDWWCTANGIPRGPEEQQEEMQLSLLGLEPEAPAVA